MMLDFGTVAQNRVEVKEGSILMFPGVDDFYTLQVDGTGTLANQSMVLYQNNADVSGTYLSGAMPTPVGRTMKTKTFTGLVGGSTYTAYIYYTDDDSAKVTVIQIVVPKLGVNPSRYQQTNYYKYRMMEGPVMILPGQSWNRVFNIAGYGAITGTPTMSLYKGTSDDSANLSGTITVAGRNISSKTISGLTGGADYICYVNFVDKGKNTLRYFEILCPKL